MRARYRCAAALAAVVMGAASAGSTVYASTMRGIGTHTGSPTWKWDHPREARQDRRNDFREDRRHDNFRDHCCDNHNHDNGGDRSRSSDCDWLRDHDHDAWLRECG